MQAACPANDDLDFSALPELPLRTIEEFDEFESKISSDSNIRHSLVRRSSFSKIYLFFLSSVFHGSCSSRDALGALSCQFWSTVLQCGARLLVHTLNYWTV